MVLQIECLHSSFVNSKKQDAVYCINCAVFSPTDERRTVGSFINTGYEGWNYTYEKQALHIGNKHHDGASNEAFELSRSLSHQIIRFYIKPMTRLRKNKKPVVR